MDNKKIVKDFIKYVCINLEYNLKIKNHDVFLYRFNNDRMAYLIADKAIEIRIKNMLLKELGLKSEVYFELKKSPNLYPDGELRVKLLI